jgi:hypothetical protein
VGGGGGHVHLKILKAHRKKNLTSWWGSHSQHVASPLGLGVAFAGGSHKRILTLPLWIVWIERKTRE